MQLLKLEFRFRAAGDYTISLGELLFRASPRPSIDSTVVDAYLVAPYVGDRPDVSQSNLLFLHRRVNRLLPPEHLEHFLQSHLRQGKRNPVHFHLDMVEARDLILEFLREAASSATDGFKMDLCDLFNQRTVLEKHLPCMA